MGVLPASLAAVLCFHPPLKQVSLGISRVTVFWPVLDGKAIGTCAFCFYSRLTCLFFRSPGPLVVFRVLLKRYFYVQHLDAFVIKPDFQNSHAWAFSCLTCMELYTETCKKLV